MLITSSGVWAQQREDTSASMPQTAKKTNRIKTAKPPYVHLVRIGFDLASVAFNIAQPNKTSYEFMADYALRNNIFLNAGTGFGRGAIDYNHLKYSTNSYFVRLGVDKSLLDKINSHDFDIAFIGAGYGIGIGQRSAANYLVSSPFGPDIHGSIPAQNFVVHWGELTAGIKVEFWKGIYAGWNLRAKFMLNPGVFEELAPNFVSGYGNADKTTSFGFNFYVCYAFRWGGA